MKKKTKKKRKNTAMEKNWIHLDFLWCICWFSFFMIPLHRAPLSILFLKLRTSLISRAWKFFIFFFILPLTQLNTYGSCCFLYLHFFFSPFVCLPNRKFPCCLCCYSRLAQIECMMHAYIECVDTEIDKFVLVICIRLRDI